MTISSPYLDTTPAANAHYLGIVLAVSDEFGVQLSDILGTRRYRTVAEARLLCYWLLRTRTRMSFPEIGQTMGRDHGTVINGVRTVVKKLGSDKQFAAMVERVTERLDA